MPTIPHEQALQRAMEHHQAGRLRRAEALYREILVLDPRCADALHLLGVIALQDGRPELAADLIRQAVELAPSRAHFHSNLGEAHRALARFDEAVVSLRRALALQPEFPMALNSLGAVLAAQHQTEEAETCYQRAIHLDPNYADAHHNLGHLFAERSQWEQAEACFHRALRLKPDSAETHNGLGNVLASQNRLDDAIAAYRQAIAFNPEFAEAHHNLAISLQRRGLLDEAVASYRRTIALKPDLVRAHYSLGIILQDRGWIDEAVACCQQVLALKPDFAEAHNRVGTLFEAQGRLDEAVVCYQRARSLKPGLAEPHNNLGVLFGLQDRLDEAIACYQQAITLQPDFAKACGNLGNAFAYLGQFDQALACLRQALALQPDFPGAHSDIILALLRSGAEAGVIEAELRRWNEQHAVPLVPFILPHANNRSPGRRLRLGYVSPDFRDHVVAHNVLPLFERHNRRDFEIFGYAQVLLPDDVTQRFRAFCDNWRDVTQLSDPCLADQIRRDEIDILVDLALHTAKNRLPVFARKPAPVQVSFAGYPGGSGLEAIDYHLTDLFLEPPHPDKTHRSDAPYHLPASFWCYEGMAVELPAGPLPALANGRVTFGCLNNFCKCNDHTLQLWARVALGVPGSRLLLLVPKGDARNRTLAQFEQAGLAADRVEFADRQPRKDYLALYRRIDVGLDTFPYNGHTTSLDSYWMGVPVVTLVGSTPVSRAGWSQLSNLGLTELAAETPDDFVHIASTLARDLPRLAALRGGLRERMRRSPLMDGAQFARDIETAYRTMWHRRCGGK